MSTRNGSSTVSQPLKNAHLRTQDVSSQQWQQQQQSTVSLLGPDTRKHRADNESRRSPTCVKNKNRPLYLPNRRRILRDLEISVDATKLIEQMQTEDRGRILVAKSLIPSGTLLFEVSPQAAICDSESRRKRCGFCLGPLNKSWNDEEEQEEVSQQPESKPTLNHNPSADQEATRFKVVKDECTGCGEIWYCDPENQDEGEEEEEQEEDFGKIKEVADRDVTDGYDTNIEGDDSDALESREAIHQKKDMDQEENKKRKKTTNTHRKSCRDQDWGTLHRFECGFLKRLFNPSARPAPTTTLDPDHEKAISRFLQLDPYDQDYCRLLIRVLICRFNELEETDNQHRPSSNSSSLQKLSNDHESGHGPLPFERVMYLVENREQYPKDRLLGPMTDVARILDAFQDHLEAYDRSQQKFDHGPANRASFGNHVPPQERRRKYNHRLSLDELLGLICKEECNSFGLYEYPNWKPTLHHYHEGPGGSSPSAQKDTFAPYFGTVRSMNAEERERYHKEHPDRVPYFLRPGFHQGLLSSSPLSSNPSKDPEDLLFLSPVERNRQRQERVFNSPNPKRGYGLGLFIRYNSPIFNHSCTPNLYHVSTNRNRLLVYTAREIASGEELNITYLEFGPGYRLFKDDLSLGGEGTEKSVEMEATRVLALERRRKILKEHFYFDCTCSRCRVELEWKDRLDAHKAARKQAQEGLVKNEKLDIHLVKEDDKKKKGHQEDNADEKIEIGNSSATLQQSAKPIEMLDKNGGASTNDHERKNLGIEEEEEQDDTDPEVFLREGLMCKRQIIKDPNGRLVDGHTDNSCYGFYAPPQVLARMKVDQFKDYKYKYEGQRRDPWACVACGHEQQRH